MKVAVLAGGFGTRLLEETEVVPKPMVAIGGRPILWHILKHFGVHGCREFCLALGYKAEVIKRYFLDYQALSRSVSLNLRSGELTLHAGEVEDWTVHLVDTGLNTMTGGRIRRMAPFLRDGTFFLTYGDGVANVDLHALLAHHRRMGRLATLTSVRPPARFGGLAQEDGLVQAFVEKPRLGEGWVNGGFMVIEPAVLDYIDGDDTVFERDVLERLATDGQLAAFAHEGFWQCMDNIRDRRLLEQLWQEGAPPWKTWA
ncbi:MAG: glucose-1-phosphate cytidylyltransferase [Candidatus Sericytochromatia bacterium]|nr:glucose-1-phosphate cytidylyltransferase [Candidatus Sericytochromatia bacterium]